MDPLNRSPHMNTLPGEKQSCEEFIPEGYEEELDTIPVPPPSWSLTDPAPEDDFPY